MLAGFAENEPAIWDFTKTPPQRTLIAFPASFGLGLAAGLEVLQKLGLLLAPAPGFSGYATGINNHGVSVGTISMSSGNIYLGETYNVGAFVSQNGEVINLNSAILQSGWVLTEAVGINDSGQIIGRGYLQGYPEASDTGYPAAYLLTPVSSNILKDPVLLEIVATLVFGGVWAGGPGWVVVNGHRLPVGPSGPSGPVQITQAISDATIGMVIDELATRIGNVASREEIRHAVLEIGRPRLDEMIKNALASRPSAVRAPAGRQPREFKSRLFGRPRGMPWRKA